MTEQDSSTGTNNDDNVVSPEENDQVSPKEEETDTQEDQKEDDSEDTSKKKEEEESEDSDTDPIDDLFTGQEPENDPANLSGTEHLKLAVDKKFDELREGLEEGKPEAIQEFRSLKPKMQEGVAKRFKIDGEEVQDAKSLLDFLGAEYPDTKEDKGKASVITEKDAELIKSNLTNQFRDQAEKSGLKFEELKKQGTYKAVVQSAKEALANMQKYNVPPSDFGKFFDFEKEWEMATIAQQKEASYKEGQKAQKKVNNANNSSPSQNSEIDTGTEGIPLATSADFMKLSKDEQIAYQRVHKGVFLD